jgi:O-antigen/teichoic acid export membrane protein
MGAAALAVYTVGTYQLPITAIVRSAVADSLFPEMVRKIQGASKEGLALWKNATLYYCFLVFPIFAILFYFAELFIVTLFTDAYRDATSVFRVALLVMIRQCFEMGTPLRAANANRYLLWGNLTAVFIHLPLLYVLGKNIGVIGAAVAWLTADLIIAIYLALQIMKRYEIGLSELALWPQVARLALCALAAGPCLLFANAFPERSLLGAALSVFLYAGVFALIVWRTRLPEIEDVMVKLWGVASHALRRKASG